MRSSAHGLQALRIRKQTTSASLQVAVLYRLQFSAGSLQLLCSFSAGYSSLQVLCRLQFSAGSLQLLCSFSAGCSSLQFSAGSLQVVRSGAKLKGSGGHVTVARKHAL